MRIAASFALMILGTSFFVTAEIHAQVDFGYVPVGATNTFTGYYYDGGSWNGTNIVMTVEDFIGPNAPEFSVSPNYAGQTLYYGSQYYYSLSFAPTNAGFSSATLTNFETPY